MKYGRILVILFCLLTAVSGSLIYAQEIRPDVGNFITEDGLAPGLPVTAAIDSGGWAWVGMTSVDKEGMGGLSIITPGRRILTFTKEDGLAGNNVQKVLFDKKNGCIWIATTEGLSRLDTKTGAWKTYSKLNSGLGSDDVRVLLMEKDGNLLAGTNGAGIYTLKPEGSIFDPIKCPFKSITGMTYDSKGRFWVSSMEGIGYRDKDVWVPFNQVNSALVSNQVLAVAEGADGTVYGATAKGLAMFDGISWKALDTTNSPLPVDNVKNVLIGGDGSIWVATWGGGVVNLDKSRELVKVYSRRNCEILDNQVTSICDGGKNNFWLCTARGVSCLSVVPQPSKTEKVRSICAQAYKWQNLDADKSKEIDVQAGLSRDRNGFVIWGWTAFFADGGFDKIDPRATLESDTLGNQWINFNGIYPGVKFAQLCLMEGDIVRSIKLDKSLAYPFPDKLTPEVQIYLKSGQYIPSDDQEVSKLAKSLIKNSSRGDMMRTAEDILFSKFFTTMPYDYSSGKEGPGEGRSTKDPRAKVVRTPAEVVKDRTGNSYSKNRLACAMLKSVGIPARLVAQNGDATWGEAYINNWGWMPFDVSLPYYDLTGNVRTRVRFPLVVEEPEMGIVSLSGADDSLKTIYWRPPAEASFTKGQELYKELTALDAFKTAQVLLVLPAEFELMAVETKIPVSKSVVMTIKKDGQYYNLKFYERKDNHLLKKFPIMEYDKTLVADVEGRVKLTVIPTQMGRHIMLRIFGWEVID